MSKIIIIGSPGAGKSTFARKLRDGTGLPLHYLDMLWHKADQTNLSREEFVRRLDEIISTEQWIMDGNYLHTLELRLRACDTVFLLDYPLEECLQGAKSRIGKWREDFPWLELSLDKEFEQWILDFSKDQLPQIYVLLGRYREDREVVIFKSRKEADDYFNGKFPLDKSAGNR